MLVTLLSSIIYIYIYIYIVVKFCKMKSEIRTQYIRFRMSKYYNFHVCIITLAFENRASGLLLIRL